MLVESSGYDVTPFVSERLLMLLSLTVCFRLIVGPIVAFDHEGGSLLGAASCRGLATLPLAVPQGHELMTAGLMEYPS